MEKTNNKHLAVAAELQELDLLFVSGSDLDVVETGYARQLIHAISTENKVLKCEALKSLGDLYLHKAKMKELKAENFHKACALYKEVLRYFRSKEERQVLQHRIRHAEICMKLTPDQNPTKLRAGNPDNVTLAVAETLQEVEKKTKMKGSDVIPLIEGYTNAFLEAIVDRDNRLKTESLKSLGDLYLEKGRVGRDEAAFTKAAGLYRAALDRCEDSDGRETLKHRIKYAEKVKEKAMKTQQEPRLPRNRKAGNDERTVSLPTSRQTAQEDTDRTYQDHLLEGCRALGTGDLDRAEEHFAAALKAVHVEGSNLDQQRKEAEPLYKLGEVYLKRGMRSKHGGDFTKAAALCNAALVRARAEDRDSIKQTIQKITRSFIKHVLSQEQTMDIGEAEKHKLMLKEDRDFVESEMKRIEQQADPYSLEDDDPKIRKVEKKRAEAINELCDRIVEQRRTFTAGLVDECMEVMGPPPCKYAMIGLGSQATGLVTPYSDLEFAILIEEETEDNVQFFRNLTHYLHLKVINLGETILPAMGIKSLNDFTSDDPQDSWFYDSVTPRGFAFDGAMPHACKTPLGRGNTCGLIHTPSEMTKVLADDFQFHLKKGYHLASILGNVCLITGEQDLVNVYADLWTEILQYTNGDINLLLAQTAFSENAEIKAVSYHEQSLQMRRSIYGEITADPLTAESLYNLGVAWSDLGDQRKAIGYLEQALQMRRSIHGENTPHPDIALSLSSMGTAWYKLGDNKEARPYFAQSLEMYRSVHGDNTAHTDIARVLNDLGITSNNVGDHRKAVSYHQQALQMRRSIHGEGTEHLDIAASLLNLGAAWAGLGDHEKAISHLEQSLQMHRSIHGEDTAHPDIADSLHNLGLAWSKIGDHRKAASYHEQSLQMRRRTFGENTAHPKTAESIVSLGQSWSNLGDHRKAVGFYKQALQMRRGVYGEDAPHPDIASSLNSLGAAWHDLGDYRKAIRYYEQSLQMRRNIYGKDTAHTDIAISLSNLGIVWSDLGDHRKAIGYHEQALQMRRSLHGKNTAHLDIVGTLGSLGTAWRKLGDYRKAVGYYEQSLKMRRSIHGEDTAHPKIAATFDNLGAAWSQLGHHRKAVSYAEQALQMRKTLYGENTAHPHIANSLGNLSVAWRNLGDQRKGLMYYELALQMKRECERNKNSTS
uniref:Uncharacterized protein n=1 Tax=Branchiostoma floridae TaxID=7739 RepID=C3ZPQ6_BRAFL|eukprot:XP_002589466.1 hypothetical protein BRAFLDRAFT_80110 [Branchiostoma floridae]